MKENQLHTPDGVRDILYTEYDQKVNLEQKIRSLFHQYGFWQVHTPTFEYYEVFSNDKGNIEPKQMYKFFDREGNILVLRPDMTPPIARMAATTYRSEEKPLRLSYLENVFRYNENFQGKMREFTQAGIEIIGIDSTETDAEAIALAIQSLLACGFKEFQLDIGNVEFFKGILEEAGFDEETGEEIRNFINRKDYIGVEDIITQHPLPLPLKQLFLELPQFFGELNILDKAKTMTKSPKALKALADLNELYKVLCDYGVEQYVFFDLGMVNRLHYYTGIIFRGYTYGSGAPILHGGRYNGLLKEYGNSQPAVGFALITNQVLAVLEQQNIKIPIDAVDTLLMYSPTGRKQAFAVSQVLRSQGMYIENSLLGEDLEKNKAYAKQKNINGILYFKDNENITLINILTEEVTYTTVSALLNID
ncbi:MAG: ATP phosphoribosyltransferase regulatory subunit [Epulopiscium sp.]|nr:ATP phosphoribosyltransferase regulatory subunit [Candidatus Epulonipiscium sp.]